MQNLPEPHGQISRLHAPKNRNKINPLTKTNIHIFLNNISRSDKSSYLQLPQNPFSKKGSLQCAYLILLQRFQSKYNFQQLMHRN